MDSKVIRPSSHFYKIKKRNLELGSLSNLSWYARKNFGRGLIAFSTKSSLYKEEYKCKKLMRETTAKSRLEKNSEECEKIK